MIRRLLPAFLLPLVVTGAALAAAAWNRAGGRDPIVLTERELPARPRSADDSAATLWLEWQPPVDDGWMPREKLLALGFDCRVDPAAPEAERHYQRLLPKELFVALELDGPAWQEWLRRTEPDRRRERPSRLVVVDAAANPATLESKYPAARTHIITRAVVRVWLAKRVDGGPYLSASVGPVIPRELHVPRNLAPRTWGKEYRATVRYGRRYEPWIVAVE